MSYTNVTHLQAEGAIGIAGASKQISEAGQTATFPGPGEALLDCQRLVPMYECR